MFGGDPFPPLLGSLRCAVRRGGYWPKQKTPTEKAHCSKIVTQPIQFNYTTASNTHHGQLGANTTLILP